MIFAPVAPPVQEVTFAIVDLYSAIGSGEGEDVVFRVDRDASHVAEREAAWAPSPVINYLKAV